MRCSDRVLRGRVLLNRSTSVALDASARSSTVQLRVLKLPEIAPRHVALKVLQSAAAFASAESIQEAFAKWVQQLPDGLVAHSGSVVHFGVGGAGDDEMLVRAMVEIAYDAEDSLSAQQLEGACGVRLCAGS